MRYIAKFTSRCRHLVSSAGGGRYVDYAMYYIDNVLHTREIHMTQI